VEDFVGKATRTCKGQDEDDVLPADCRVEGEGMYFLQSEGENNLFPPEGRARQKTINFRRTRVKELGVNYTPHMFSSLKCRACARYAFE